nr:hypothetical protein [Tanacetum cinerariifolium]
MEDLKQQHLDELKRLSNLEYRDEIKIAELMENFNGMSIEIQKKEKLLQQEQWACLSTHPSKRLHSFCFDDDNDEDYTSAITPDEPVLSIEEPDNSLSMGDEHLDTVSATESDEFIKSSVENLIPIPSESEGIPDHRCDVPSHDNSPPLDVSKTQFEDLFESNENFLRLMTILSLLTISTMLRHHLQILSSSAQSESFSPSPILVKDSDSLMEEIDLFCTPDYPMPPGIVDKDYHSERDILIPKDLPSNNTLSFAEKESFHFDILPFSRPPAKPLDGDTGILNIKMMGDISDQKAFMHKLMITLAPHQEKSPDLISYRYCTVKKFNTYRSHLNECPMLIHGQNNPPLDVLLIYFYPP